LFTVIPGRGHLPANPESIVTSGDYGFWLSPLPRLGRNDEMNKQV